MEKPLKVKLHIISPVHIGCGDVYEPTGFVIDEKKEKLIEFDQLSFIKSLSSQDKHTFSAYCMQENIYSIVRICKFLAGKQIKGREVSMAKGLIPHYKRIVSLPFKDERELKQDINRFEINRTTYNPHNSLPYIPGSSLKGSLRTAYLSKLAVEGNLQEAWRNYLHTSQLDPASARYNLIGKFNVAKKTEKALLGGDFDTDPFRMVKISDFLPVGDVNVKIFYAVNKKKKVSKFEAGGPYQIFETITGNTVFEGIFNIEQPSAMNVIRKPVSKNSLLQSISSFYTKRLEEEKKVLHEIGITSTFAKRLDEKFKGKLGKSAFLVRIGRHSGAEAVTIEGNRIIRIQQKRGEPAKFFDHATTTWFAAENSKPATNQELIPFGWAVLELADEL